MMCRNGISILSLIHILYIGLDRGQEKPNYTIEVERGGEKIVLDDVKLQLHKVMENGKEEMRYGLSFQVEESLSLIHIWISQ